MCWFLQVRIKPQMSKFEVDLAIDTECENYDQDRDEHLQISTQVSHFSIKDSFSIFVTTGEVSRMCYGAA